MKYSRRFLILPVVLFFGVCIARAADESQDAGVLRYKPNAPQLSALSIAAINPRLRPLSEPLPGRIAYDEDRTSRISSPVVGRVIRIGAEPGDAVRKGQQLLELDSPDLGSALADVAKADADLAQYSASYERARTLFEGQALARKDLVQAESDLSKAEAESRRAKMRLHNLLPEGGKSPGETYILRTPINGVVTERHVNPGMEVRPDLQDPLFVISDPTHLWVIVELTERDLGKLRTGQSVGVSVDAYPGQTFMARVANISDVLDPATRRVRARVILDNPERRLKPEMFARVMPLADRSQPVLVVPNSALVTEGRRTFVFVETIPGELHKRAVQLGLQTRDFSVVESGLNAGDRVVTSGAVLLNSDLQR